jgi:hypothetical protein
MTKMYIGIHVKYPLFFSYVNENLIFLTDFRKILSYQVHKYPSNDSRVATCGHTNSHDEANSPEIFQKRLLLLLLLLCDFI